MNNLKPGLFILFSISLLNLYAEGPILPTSFKFKRSIQTTELQRESLGAIALDRHMLSHCQDDFSDIVIFDDKNTLHHVMVRNDKKNKTRRSLKRVAVQVEALNKSANVLSIDLKLNKDSVNIHSIRIKTPLKDYERNVTVQSSDEGRNWKTILKDQLIFDYSSFMDFSNFEINLNHQPVHKYLRLVIEAATDQQISSLKTITEAYRQSKKSSSKETYTIRDRDFRIDEILVFTENEEVVSGGTKEIKLPLKISEEKKHTTAKYPSTVYFFQTEDLPLIGVSLQTNNNFFRHRFKLDIPHPRHDWQTIQTGTISKVQYRHQTQQKLDISFNETRAPVMRLTIELNDQKPLQIEAIEGTSLARRLFFISRPDLKFDLYYGSREKLKHDHNATHALENLMTRFEPQRFKLAKVEMNPEYLEEQDKDLSSWMKNIYSLYLVLGLMVAALGWGIYKSMKGMDQSSSV